MDPLPLQVQDSEKLRRGDGQPRSQRRLSGGDQQGDEVPGQASNVGLGDEWQPARRQDPRPVESEQRADRSDPGDG